MSVIEWGPWIEHDGSDKCPEGVKGLAVSKRHWNDEYPFGDDVVIRGEEWMWNPGVKKYRIPLADHKRIYGEPEEKKVYARAPEGCEEYLTPGKVYQTRPFHSSGDDTWVFEFCTDGYWEFSGWTDSCHLNGGNWERLELTESEAAEINAAVDSGGHVFDATPDTEAGVEVQYSPDDVASNAPMTDHDTVNAPSHYASGEIECIDAIRAQMTEEQFAGYLRGNVVKYLWRYEHKGGVESLRKAEWYLRRLIDVVE